jgi:hypothetical protein
MKIDISTILDTLAPSKESMIKEVDDLRKSFPQKTKIELANLLGDRITRKYTSIGIASSLPSVIPGFGTAAQIAVEAGTISADLALLLRWMANLTYGIALINGKDMEEDFNKEFLKVLGIWCGVIKSVKEVSIKIGIKAASAQFNKHVSGKMLLKINQKVGTTILTKYGTKRGGIAIGKLIPIGVGVLVGGSFNYYTMKAFKRAATKYFFSDDNFIIEIEGEYIDLKRSIII